MISLTVVPGAVTAWVEPTGDGVRVDSGSAAGTTVTPLYDSVLVHNSCNLPFRAELLEHPEFVSGRYDTGLVARMHPWSG